MNQNTIQARHEELMVFVKDGITFLPNYRNSCVFVGPGYGKDNLTRYTEFELYRMGAEKAYLSLWLRGKHGTVNEVKP